MDESLIILIILSLCLGTGCWLIFIWAVKKGEFEDVEKPKHRMLDDD
jgi:cbb3-type cytochrome oxidase maturation protein